MKINNKKAEYEIACATKATLNICVRDEDKKGKHEEVTVKVVKLWVVWAQINQRWSEGLVMEKGQI